MTDLEDFSRAPRRAEPGAARLHRPAALGFPEPGAGPVPGSPAPGPGEADELRQPPACVSCRRYAHAPGTTADGHQYQPPRRVGHHAYGADAAGRMVVHRPSMAGEVTADFPYLERKDGDWVKPDHDGLEQALDWARQTLAADSLVDHVVIRQSVQEHDGQPWVAGRTVKIVTRSAAGPGAAASRAPASRRLQPGDPGTGRAAGPH
jgi:hypothetical protein